MGKCTKWSWTILTRAWLEGPLMKFGWGLWWCTEVDFLFEWLGCSYVEILWAWRAEWDLGSAAYWQMVLAKAGWGCFLQRSDIGWAVIMLLKVEDDGRAHLGLQECEEDVSELAVPHVFSRDTASSRDEDEKEGVVSPGWRSLRPPKGRVSGSQEVKLLGQDLIGQNVEANTGSWVNCTCVSICVSGPLGALQCHCDKWQLFRLFPVMNFSAIWG